MNLPSDPNELARYYMFMGATIAMKSMNDALMDIQVFTIPELWPEGSKELEAVGDAIEGLKLLVAKRAVELVDAAKELCDGD